MRAALAVIEGTILGIKALCIYVRPLQNSDAGSKYFGLTNAEAIALQEERPLLIVQVQGPSTLG